MSVDSLGCASYLRWAEADTFFAFGLHIDHYSFSSLILGQEQ